MQLKTYEELELTDNFMFCKVLTHHPELCRHFVELIIDRPVKNIRFRDYEKTIMITPDSKGIRLDVYLADESGTVYNLEMQNSNRRNLPKRIRYYQGMIDLDAIQAGARYSHLPRTLIVFLCPFDYYHQGIPVYRFERRCVDDPALSMGDETEHILVNLTAPTENLAEEAQALYYYLMKHEATDPFTDELDAAVAAARSHSEWRVEYMNNRAYEMDHEDDLDAARAEGLETGRAEGTDDLVLAVQRLRAGDSAGDLIAAGIAPDILEKAKLIL